MCETRICRVVEVAKLDAPLIPTGHLIRALVSLFCFLGCVEPQSGSHAASWCGTSGAYTLLDDFEDGDAVPCEKVVKNGAWSTWVDADGSGAAVTQARAVPSDLSAEDMAVRPGSTRAQHLTATLGPAGVARLVVTFDPVDLSAYSEIDFFARSDGNRPQISVAVVTASATDAAYFMDSTVTISPQWGEGGNSSNVNNVALYGLYKVDGTLVSAGDLAASSGIEFQLSGVVEGAGPVGLWIDDVQLKRK